MKRFLLCLLILSMVFALIGCTVPTPPDTAGAETDTQTEPTPDIPANGEYRLDLSAAGAPVPNEGNGRVYYQIFVGSFSDSDGNGIGDLRGIINRFDYLNDGDPNSGLSLGVEGIWLSPIFESPSYHKYDVADYYAVDSDFGTMEDLKELIDLCHSRDVQIILDLPINHSSTANLSYVRFLNAHRDGTTDSEYYDYYSWTTEPQAGRTYSLIPGTRDYYECNFSGDMPELNFDLPAVRQDMVDAAAYYLDLGVDGFRFDAAKYIYFGEETRNIEFWDWYMAQLRAIKPDIYTVAEVWDGDGVVIPYFSSTNCFNFSMSQVNGRIAEAAKAGNVNVFTGYVDQYLDSIKAQNPDALLCTFIANHDMDRAAGYLTLASGQAKVAASLSILTPGSPFIYYGEEIALKGSRGGSNTDANRRLAMLWGDGDTVRDPIGANYDSPQSNGSAADQITKADSLYNHYKKLIAIRKAHPEIAYGEFTPLTTDSKLGGFLSAWNGSTVAVFHNSSQSSVTVDLAGLTDVPLTVISAWAGVGDAVLEGTVLTIAGQTSVVLK